MSAGTLAHLLRGLLWVEFLRRVAACQVPPNAGTLLVVAPVMVAGSG
jgi:hypothetical protein